MAWSCPICKVNYKRRLDHDQSASAAACKRQELEEARATHTALLKQRDALEVNTGQLDKEMNRAWRKVRRLQGW
jgi:hypothetical protein